MIQITYHPIIYCFVYIKHNILSKVLIIYRHLTPLKNHDAACRCTGSKIGLETNQNGHNFFRQRVISQ